AIWGMWIHSNVNVHSGSLQLVLNGPEAHRWHHAVDVEAYGRNLATKFALWDRLFGTAYLPVDRKPSGYGLPGFPEGYLDQQLHAFRPMSEPISSPLRRVVTSGRRLAAQALRSRSRRRPATRDSDADRSTAPAGGRAPDGGSRSAPAA